MSKIESFDCVIIGGGMVGAASALSLAQLGLSVAIVEKYQPQEFSSEQPVDLRVSAISLASQYLFEQLDVWHQLKAWRSCEYQRLGVWEDNDAYVEFNAQELGQHHLGHIIENRLIQLALWQQIKKHNNICLYCPDTLQEYNEFDDTITVKLTTREIKAKLLIAADGANSQLRQQANIGITGWDYQQSAMLINVKTQLPQQNITWQQFLPTGPVAMLPLPCDDNNQGSASLVWYHHKDKIKDLMSLSNRLLKEEILKTFPQQLGDIDIVNKASFPLTRRHANNYKKGHVLLLGDAAHTINPLAGQGVNLGFQDVIALQAVIRDAIANNEDWSCSSVLKRYEKKRRMDNLIMMTAMDIFYAAFSHPSMVVKSIRNNALNLVNKVKPLKKQILKHACGLNQ